MKFQYCMDPCTWALALQVGSPLLWTLSLVQTTWWAIQRLLWVTGKVWGLLTLTLYCSLAHTARVWCLSAFSGFAIWIPRTENWGMKSLECQFRQNKLATTRHQTLVGFGRDKSRVRVTSGHSQPSLDCLLNLWIESSELALYFQTPFGCSGYFENCIYSASLHKAHPKNLG